MIIEKAERSNTYHGTNFRFINKGRLPGILGSRPGETKTYGADKAGFGLFSKEYLKGVPLN